MESNQPSDAAAALADVDSARHVLSDRAAPGTAFLASLGAAVAVTIACMGTGFARQQLWLAVVGALVFAVVASAQLLLVRRSGAWVSDLAHDVVLGASSLASGAYVVALLATVWAAAQEQWWVVGLLSVAGGAAYAWSGRRWVAAFRETPEQHAGRRSGALVAATAVAAALGLVALLLGAR